MSESIFVSPSSASEVSLRDLQTVLSIANSGSFRTSARLLHTSQPAISRAVKRVETYFGTEIFVRGPRGASLSTSGEEILAIVGNALDELAKARRDVSSNGAKTIRIGAAPAAVGVLLADTINYWTKRYPHHRIEIVEQGADMLHRMLMAEQCDIVIIAPPFQSQISGLFLRTIPVRALFSPDSPGAIEGEPITLTELSESPLLIYTAGFISTTLLLNAFRQVAIQPRISYQSTNAMALLRMAESGLGVAVVGGIVDSTHTNLVSRPIVADDGSMLSFDLHVAWLSKNTDPEILQFARMVEEQAQG